MARDINKVILVGRMVRDPELRYTQNSTSVASFSIANNNSYTKDGNKVDQSSFFNCTAWSKLGEVIVQYCKKGQQILVEGRLQQRTWEDQEGRKRSTVEIVCENVQLLSKPGENSQIDTAQSSQVGDNPFSDDDIPF